MRQRAAERRQSLAWVSERSERNPRIMPQLDLKPAKRATEIAPRLSPASRASDFLRAIPRVPLRSTRGFTLPPAPQARGVVYLFTIYDSRFTAWVGYCHSSASRTRIDLVVDWFNEWTCYESAKRTFGK